MPDLIRILQDAVGVAFFLLGLATFVQWIRRRDGSLVYLALAIVLLALVVSLGRISAEFGIRSALAGPLNLVLFIASGYSLLRFRAHFLGLSRTWEVIAATAAVAAVVVSIPLSLAAMPAELRGPLTVFLIAVYCGLVGEPIVRFWLASRGLPSIQRWRLRSLSLGFAALLAVLVFAVALGALLKSALVSVVIEVVVLAIVPLLYVSFSPPAWLRRQWRAAEEEGLERYMQGLITGHPSREQILQGAFEWAARLAGARRALAVTAAGVPIAGWSVGDPGWPEAGEGFEISSGSPPRVTVQGRQRAALFLSLRGYPGADRLVVVGGPFSPSFGSDEASRVQQHLNAVAAALERLSLIEGLREANAQLREANQHKTVFLANMSHELRTPLNAILGFSELLIDDDGGQYDGGTRASFLEQIHSSGKHLLNLINDILDLSKVEAGQMELHLEEVDLAGVVKDVLDTVRPLAAVKESRLEGDASGNLTADAGKLKQMLLNLVSNAIKFTPEKGWVRVSSHIEPPWLELDVSDTGIGIAPDDTERIFEAFQQLDSSAGRQQAGTGLGLTLTRRFAALHGGEVTVESLPGQGSVFTIRLPLEPVQPAPAEPPAEDAPEVDAAGPLVVVVEDNPANAELLVRQLRRGGYAVELARSGAEALSKAAELTPAAITLDILLPELDGWAVLTRLKEDPATRDIPVLIISVVDDRELGLALGALDYLVKPVAGRELLDRLAHIVAPGGNGSGLKTVLVVDDEEANRTWLRHVLEPAGFKVVAVDGGSAAIEQSRQDPPDLMLLDLMMPEVTGFDVVEALRDDPRTRSIPVLILTAKNLTAEDKRLLNGHVAGILARGSTGAVDLLSWLRRVLGETVPA